MRRKQSGLNNSNKMNERDGQYDGGPPPWRQYKGNSSRYNTPLPQGRPPAFSAPPKGGQYREQYQYKESDLLMAESSRAEQDYYWENEYPIYRGGTATMRDVPPFE